MKSNHQKSTTGHRKPNLFLGMTSIQAVILSILSCSGPVSIVVLMGLIFYNVPISYRTKASPTKDVSGQDARNVLVIDDSYCGRSPENQQIFTAEAYLTNTSDFDITNVIITVEMLDIYGNFFTDESNYYDPNLLSLGAYETSLVSFNPSISTGTTASCRWSVDNAVYK
ncbi:MAG: hypothetical protein HYZ21_15730 [Chloroflexi bacterium]|nr:hypothetical protein [Chloroflexota bacterium]